MIYSITEAYSMQPKCVYIGYSLEGGKVALFTIGGLDNETIYAHDDKGKIIAEYQRRAVNIEYQ